MAETNLQLIALISILIAAIAFFANKRISMLFILIFIYLLPRAGFLVDIKWYNYPLPIGYLFIIFIMLKWFSNLLFEKVRLKKETPIDKAFLFYILIAGFAIIMGLLNGGNTPIMMLEVAVYFAAFFIFFMILDMFDNEACIKIFMNGILICGFLVSIYGVLLLTYGQKLLINYVTYNSSNYLALTGQFIIAKRTISTYGDPNTLSAQLMVFCGIFASMFLLAKCHPIKKMFLFIGFISTLACIYFASSRASLIGLFIMLIIFSIIRIKKLEFFVPTLITGYIMFIEPIRRYYEHRIYRTGMQTDVRITYIQTFLDLLGRFPLGVGFGNNVDARYHIIPAVNIWGGFNSFYLHIFSRVGLQGLVVFSFMLFLIIRYLLRASRRIEDPNVRWFVFGGACGLIVQQINFLANNVYHVPGGMLNFWIMCGMLTAIANIYTAKSKIISP